jgi:hypothetical protein
LVYPKEEKSMKFSEYIIEKFHNGEEKLHILLYGQGGVGKTHNFYELYAALLDSDIPWNGKKIIPVYVPLKKYGSRGTEKRRTFVREYFWKNYFPEQVLEENLPNEKECLLAWAEREKD